MNHNEALKNIEITLAQSEEPEATYPNAENSSGEEAHLENFRGFLPQDFDESILRYFALPENEN